jgi:hypothetical protein
MQLTTAQFPNFSVQANDSFLTTGDTVVINCLLYNVSLDDINDGYNITWFKDEIKLTQDYTTPSTDAINDTRYGVNIVSLKIGMVFSLQIKCKGNF